MLEYRDQPGDTTAMHSHPDILAYAISGGKFKFTLANGESFEAALEAGESMFNEAHDHSTENIGETASHVLLVELK